MQPIVEMKFGSHLYGTSTPASDLDIKAVHLPDATDLLLQRAKPVLQNATKIGNGRNTAEDTDFESYSLQKYLALVAEGQTVALDMLFAPDWAMLSEPLPLWRKIQHNKDRLLTRRYASFVGYCRTQANKYGIKGSRVAAARAALAILAEGMDRLGTTPKLAMLESQIDAVVASQDHSALVDQEMLAGTVVRHWEVCGRKMPYTATIKSAHDIMARLVADYGARALAAEKNQGVDWKALSHAVRIARQAIELLETGAVMFPRPDAQHLLAIKTGTLDYHAVALEIEAQLVEIEAASIRSSLPDAPDYAWIESLITKAHRDLVLGAG